MSTIYLSPLQGILLLLFLLVFCFTMPAIFIYGFGKKCPKCGSRFFKRRYFFEIMEIKSWRKGKYVTTKYVRWKFKHHDCMCCHFLRLVKRKEKVYRVKPGQPIRIWI